MKDQDLKAFSRKAKVSWTSEWVRNYHYPSPTAPISYVRAISAIKLSKIVFLFTFLWSMENEVK